MTDGAASGLDRQPRAVMLERLRELADEPFMPLLSDNDTIREAVRQLEVQSAEIAALRTQLEQVQDEWLKLEVHLARSAAYEVGYGLGLCDGASKAYRECADRLDTILSGSGETT